MSWKSGMRAIDKLERLTVVAGTLKQELLKRLYVVFGSECVNEVTMLCVILCPLFPNFEPDNQFSQCFV